LADKDSLRFGAVTVVSERFPASIFRAAEKFYITDLAKDPRTLTEEDNLQKYVLCLRLMWIENPGLGKLKGLQESYPDHSHPNIYVSGT
jgi:hypothetical protein